MRITRAERPVTALNLLGMHGFVFGHYLVLLGIPMRGQRTHEPLQLNEWQSRLSAIWTLATRYGRHNGLTTQVAVSWMSDQRAFWSLLGLPRENSVATARSSNDEVDLRWFRLVVVVGLVASVWITWPLWNVRIHPALLPALELPQFSLGVPLIVATVAALVAPLQGTMLVTTLVAYGMATDQTRMQPEFYSLPILLWGSLPISAARLIARTHLLALWFYAGAHKLISRDYWTESERQLFGAVPFEFASRILIPVALAIALAEMGTSALAIWPATRQLAAWLALFVHGGILVALASLGEWRNTAIWPWNIVLACNGFALIAPWTTGVLKSFRAISLAPRVVAVVIAVMPIGYYAGIVDAYPAHHLYSSGTARATVYCPAGCRPEQDINATWHELNVPLPPEPRLFYASFAMNCAPGDVLRIEIPRPPPWSGAVGSSVEYCPAGSLPASHP